MKLAIMGIVAAFIGGLYAGHKAPQRLYIEQIRSAQVIRDENFKQCKLYGVIGKADSSMQEQWDCPNHKSVFIVKRLVNKIKDVSYAY